MGEESGFVCSIDDDPEVIRLYQVFHELGGSRDASDLEKANAFRSFQEYPLVAQAACEVGLLNIQSEGLRLKLASSLLLRIGPNFASGLIENFGLSVESEFKLACLAAELDAGGLCGNIERFTRFSRRQYLELLERMLASNAKEFFENRESFIRTSGVSYRETMERVAVYGLAEAAEFMTNEPALNTQESLRVLLLEAVRNSAIENAKLIAGKLHDVNDPDLNELAFLEEYEPIRQELPQGLATALDFSQRRSVSLPDETYRALAGCSADTAEFILAFAGRPQVPTALASLIASLDRLMEEGRLSNSAKRVIGMALESDLGFYSGDALCELLAAEGEGGRQGVATLIAAWSRLQSKILHGEPLSIDERKSDIYRDMAHWIYRDLMFPPFSLKSLPLTHETIDVISGRLPEKGEEFVFAKSLLPVNDGKDCFVAHASAEAHAYLAISSSCSCARWLSGGVHRIVLTHPASAQAVGAILLDRFEGPHYSLDILINHIYLIAVDERSLAERIVDLLVKVVRDNGREITYTDWLFCLPRPFASPLDIAWRRKFVEEFLRAVSERRAEGLILIPCF